MRLRRSVAVAARLSLRASALLFVLWCGACDARGDDAATTSAGGAAGSSGGAASGRDDASAPSDGAPLIGQDASSDGASRSGDVDQQDPAFAAGQIHRFPEANATDVCPDAPLHLAFGAPVSLGTAGKIQLWRADANAGLPVDTIDIAATSFTATIGGRSFNRNRPVLVDNADVVIAFQPQAMVRGATYYVTIDKGVFGQNSLGWVSGSSAWRFTTRGRAPSSPGNLTVAADGSGDFCTVQGAVDAVPTGNTTPVKITVKKGTYREIVFIAQKSNITLHGEDRKTTVIAYANNNTLNPHTNTRAMVEVEGSNGLIVENITLHNMTPQGGSQAEALRVEPSDQVVLRDADFISTQDTLLLTGRVYVSNCYVEGNVDFIWGKGTAYFERCELRTVGRAGYEVQARNLAGAYGYVFVDSTLTSSPGITGNFLGRIDVSAYPGSQVAYINCKMDKHIDPKGWLITGAGSPTSSDAGAIAGSDAASRADGGGVADASGQAAGEAGSAASLRFAEYQSTDLAGQPLDVSQRVPESKQLTASEAATMRDQAVVLSGWNPTAVTP